MAHRLVNPPDPHTLAACEPGCAQPTWCDVCGEPLCTTDTSAHGSLSVDCAFTGVAHVDCHAYACPVGDCPDR